MEFRKIGQSDLEVSLIGLGCNNFSSRIDFETSKLVINKALELGINFFDTADVYGNKGGSEEFIGDILGNDRKQIILATKFGMPMDKDGEMSGASAKYILKAIESSLKRLKTDWIDLYQVHRPDLNTDPEETMRALENLISEGKVRYIGCSNYSSQQLILSQNIFKDEFDKMFISSQDEYSLLVRDIEENLVTEIENHKMSLLPYFPLASGFLTGKYKKDKYFPENSRFLAWPQLVDKYMSDENWIKIKSLENFCDKYNLKLLDISFRWLASKKYVSSIIAGATSAQQVEQNVNSLKCNLSENQLKEINRIISA